MSKVQVNRMGHDVRDPLTRCKICIGSGKMMGGGMIMCDCDACYGTGHTTAIPEPPAVKIDQNSQHYKSAIKRIKALNDKITDAEAEKMFKDEFDKLD